MGILAIISVLSVLLAANEGTSLVLLFSGLGGLSGLAAIATVYITHKANAKRAAVDDKSVAIIELEKAVPGMGDIIKEWQNIVHQLQADLVATRTELAECRKALQEHRPRTNGVNDV